jgi:ATP-dependent DNA ligase
LVYSGNVGTGFDDRMLDDIRRRLDGLGADESPFDVFEAGSMRFGRGVKESEITWERPEMVVA